MALSDDAIIAMAREAGSGDMGLNVDGSDHLIGLFERFAALIAAKEREACALVCDAKAKDGTLSNRRRCDADSMAMAIRARGKP